MNSDWPVVVRGRVSYDQMKALVDFMGQHVEFAKGVLRTTEARQTSKRLWEELARTTNGIRGGTKKTPDMWSKYWSDLKNKLKKKVQILNRSKQDTSGTASAKNLTKLDKRILVILGSKFVKIKQRDRPGASCVKYLPAEVKVEEEHNDSDFCTEFDEDHDRLSDGDGNGESEGSNHQENGDSTGNDFNDSALQNIYPEWLIEVEKKRAEADLIRARAEEQRVLVTAKNAETALLQADALKKLSEAATVQADAIRRIAVFLENRGHTAQDLLPI